MKDFIDRQLELIDKIRDKIANIKLATSLLKQTPNSPEIISMRTQLIKEYWELKHDFFEDGLPGKESNVISHGSVGLAENHFNND